MKILLFGGSGFIGQRVAERLTEHQLILPTSREVNFIKPDA